MKNQLLYFGLIASVLLFSCKEKKKSEYLKIAGFAQGTTYHITYENTSGKDYTAAFDSILRAFDKSLSIYDSTSIVSQINDNKPGILVDDWFVTTFNKAREINQLSDGAFDITVGPVCRAWGFGNGPESKHSKAYIDSLLQFVGMEKVRLEGRQVIKSAPGVQLDFNALAQGYSVDIVCDFLNNEGVSNYLVEIGGELKGKGVNATGNPWRVGIDKPIDGNMIPGQELQTILKTDGRAVTTSGNYRKFYIENGVKYSHTIDPQTGFPARNTLLSATVVADDCITADALATSFMVLGVEKSKTLVSKLPNIDVYFIFSDEQGNYQTFSTERIKNMLIDPTTR